LKDRTLELAVQQIVPVILSGGSGTRLWPVSRTSFPKQFWPLVSSTSMLAETALRTQLPNFTAPIIVANQEHRFIVAEQLREAGVATPQILLEPVGRNSAMAIAAAAALVAETTPDAVMLIMAADAAITNVPALTRAIETAAAAARAGYIVTFGMQPTAPETGYGYIAKGHEVDQHPGVFRIKKFVEKPDADTAKIFLNAGGYLWNSGMFVAKASVLLAEMAEHATDVLSAAQKSVETRTRDLDFIRLGTAAFNAAPNISFDYAVAEKTNKMVVVPAAIGWSDVGSWAALADITAGDAHKNVALGEVVIEDSENSYARSDGAVTALLGVKDLIVITTQDAVLVAHKDHSQNVKKIVDRLKREKRPQAESHNRIYRPWGFYESLISGDRFQVKRIVVFPNCKLSLQKHFHRAEHWVVVSGCALVTRDEQTHMVQENESIYLPLGCIHRMENPGKIPLTLIEVQSGSYLGEDDIIRIEDTYGRA
jgi:mannose-1-phosphate guanylyltransferase/mannose-1-phosphate guanylyltransferase/mannose-6-phosphate isomerase